MDTGLCFAYSSKAIWICGGLWMSRGEIGLGGRVGFIGLGCRGGIKEWIRIREI